jgi:(S)-2-hydroxyglutarate dehydrogenase
MTYDYLIIGAGIVGLATARRLQERFPHAQIAVIEKEPAVAMHQSGHNSGVVHAGVYYAPGSLKARLCRLGAKAVAAFCTEHGLPFERCGKLIVATTSDELPRLQALAERARENGLSIETLSAAAIAEREPEIRGLGAIFVPETGIADYPALCNRLVEIMRQTGGNLYCDAEVLGIRESDQQVVVETRRETFIGKQLVVCGGLQADRLASLAGVAIDFAIVPFRGDYFTLPAERGGIVKTLIYPVPDPRLPFLGVHLTLTTSGHITLGPSAMLAFAREDYRQWRVNRRDLQEMLCFPGTWRLLARYPQAGLVEISRALSRRAYLAAVRRYCPDLTLADLTTPSCGIRAQAVGRDGQLIHDFLLLSTKRSVHVCNAPSPAATSAFPIADTIVEQITRLV